MNLSDRAKRGKAMVLQEALEEEIKKGALTKIRERMNTKIVIQTVLFTYLGSMMKIGLELVALGQTAQTVESLYSTVSFFILSIIGAACLIFMGSQYDKMELNIKQTAAENKKKIELMGINNQKERIKAGYESDKLAGLKTAILDRQTELLKEAEIKEAIKS